MPGILHIAAAVVLLPAAAVFGLITVPVFLPGLIWIATLGIFILRKRNHLCKALKMTQVILLSASVLFIIYGIWCLEAAHRSAETGGGLLGAVGLIPIASGILTGSLSALSLFVIRHPESKKQTKEM